MVRAPVGSVARKLHDAVQHDIEVLGEIWQRVRDIKPAKDAKLQALKELLAGKLAGQKLLIFTYYSRASVRSWALKAVNAWTVCRMASTRG